MDTINIWYGSNDNAELSNLADRPFVFRNRQFCSVEHAYQTYKSGSFCQETYELPWSAGRKLIGKSKVNPAISYRVMLRLIHESLEQNPIIKRQLLATGEATITHNPEQGYWAEAFPEILMRLRSYYACKGADLED